MAPGYDPAVVRASLDLFHAYPDSGHALGRSVRP
jgi:hypothetical protein